MNNNMILPRIACTGALLLSLTALHAAGPYDRRTPAVEAFEKNKDAVVNIATKYVKEYPRNSFYDYRSLEDFFYGPRTRRYEYSSLGTGFIVDARGYVVTNAHVIAGATEVTVIMADESRHLASVVAENAAEDIALLKIDAGKELPSVLLGRSDDLLIGETVLAIGNPFGYDHTLTHGILSAIHREIEVKRDMSLKHLLQISAPINPGSSGGPLININGEVIGINTAIREAAEGIGFAIPIDQLQETLPAMIDPDTLSRLDFGATVGKPILPGGSAQSGPIGAEVRHLRRNSAAEKAGLQQGDIITRCNGKSVQSALQLSLELLQLEVGDTVELEFNRIEAAKKGPVSRKENIKLKARPKPNARGLARKLFGIKVGILTGPMMNKYDIYGQVGDAVIMSIDRQSPAEKTGLEPGDVLKEMGDSEIKDLDDLGLKLEDVVAGDIVNLVINRTLKRRRGHVVQEGTFTLHARGLDTI